MLEDGIRTYLENQFCATQTERREFEEIRRWFEPRNSAPLGPFSFGSICSQLQIDAKGLLRTLRSVADEKAVGTKGMEILAA